VTESWRGTVPSRAPAWGEQTSPGKMRERTRVLICCLVSQCPAQAAHHLCGQAAACSLVPRPRPLLQPGWSVLAGLRQPRTALCVHMSPAHRAKGVGRYSSAFDAARASASLIPVKCLRKARALLRQACARCCDRPLRPWQPWRSLQGRLRPAGCLRPAGRWARIQARRAPALSAAVAAGTTATTTTTTITTTTTAETAAATRCSAPTSSDAHWHECLCRHCPLGPARPSQQDNCCPTHPAASARAHMHGQLVQAVGLASPRVHCHGAAHCQALAQEANGPCHIGPRRLGTHSP
jgi:hypothetical protein